MNSHIISALRHILSLVERDNEYSVAPSKNCPGVVKIDDTLVCWAELEEGIPDMQKVLKMLVHPMMTIKLPEDFQDAKINTTSKVSEQSKVTQ
jgi:hypothetical protein